MPPGSRLVHSEALKDERMGWWMGWSLLAIGLLRAPSGLKEGSTRKKVAVLLDFVQISPPPPPLPPIWTTCTTFFNAKNVDLRDIQNDSLSKILLK